LAGLPNNLFLRKHMISNPKSRRSAGLEGLKILMGTGAMAATIGLWSLFANRDFISQLTQPDTSVSTQSSNDVMLDLPPIPTLVQFASGSAVSALPTTEPAAVNSQDLRSVSAPSQASGGSGTVPGPRVVRNTGGGGGGGGGGGTVTTTRSS
jgi:hypothetical protein